MLSELTPSQRALADHMSDLSEEAYCAGWLIGLEFILWEAVLGREEDDARLPFSEEEIERLRDLSEACSGWIVYQHPGAETWLPLEEWERRFAEWEERAEGEEEA